MATRGSTLVVVESPAKAKTIKKYLGANYQVLASKGHVWDLPKKYGIDIEKGFQESYEVIEGKEKTVAEIKAAAKDSDAIMLATDPDREGEAIAWHIGQELKSLKKPMRRVLFQEITKRGVTDGIEHPRDLDTHLYDAQRTRRILDRIVGYDVSSLVWSKLAFGLSAGRVQSVALRLIVDREREIEAFVPEEYWNLGVRLLGKTKPSFAAKLVSYDGKQLSKDKVGGATTARRIEADLNVASYKVAKVTRAERQRKAPAPYTTSKLQQDAANMLRFPAKRTMQVAQGLYEGVELGKELGSVGLITYMRTDSTRVSDDAVKEAREYIKATFTGKHLPASANIFKSRKSAQDAHEAIRPTTLELPPEKVAKYLKPEQLKLYRLIWNRFVACQMSPAIYDQTSVDIEATVAANKGQAPYGLRASGRVLKFGGWLDAYTRRAKDDDEEALTELAGEEEAEKAEAIEANAEVVAKDDTEETELPPIEQGEILSIVTPPGVNADQKFTQPPPRFNEGSLVRALEERGIGRPSTYAEIISKVQGRNYVDKPDGRTFKPTELGKMVVDGLVLAALDFMNPDFTAAMEEQLDQVESGKLKREKLLDTFYKRFKQQLDAAKKAKRWTPEPAPTDEKCQICGKPMLKRWSKNGWFLGCSDYPKCKGTRPLEVNEKGETVAAAPPQLTDYKCDKCGKPMAIRSGRYGQFLSCTGYPECKNAQPVPLGVKCPKCKTGDIIEVRPMKKGGRTFYGCSNYKDESLKCDFKLWAKPVLQPCPDCGAEFMTRGGSKTKPMLVCVTEGCGHKEALPIEDDVGAEQLAAGP